MFKFEIGMVLKQFGIGSKVSHSVSSSNALDDGNPKHETDLDGYIEYAQARDKTMFILRDTSK